MRKHSAVLHIVLELSSKAVSYCLMKIIDVLTSIYAMHQFGSSKLSNLLTLRAMEVQCVIASLSAHSVRWPLPNQSEGLQIKAKQTANMNPPFRIFRLTFLYRKQADLTS